MPEFVKVKNESMQSFKKINSVVMKLNQLFALHFLANGLYSKISLIRPLEIKTTSLLRPDFASPKCYFTDGITFNNKTTSLIRPHLGSPKGGLNRGILLYMEHDL